MTDCLVTVWDCGYFRTGSTARDFRLLTGVVLRTALERAGTVVCEALTRLSLDVPSQSSAGVMKLLGQSMARIEAQFSANGRMQIAARIPTANLSEVKRRLPGLTSGEGVLEDEFAGFEPVIGPPPERRRRAAEV